MTAARRSLEAGLIWLAFALVCATPMGALVGNGVLTILRLLTGYEPLGTL